MAEALGGKTSVKTPDKPKDFPLSKTEPRKVKSQGEEKSHLLRNATVATILTLTGGEVAGGISQEMVNNEPVSGHTLVQDAIWPVTIIGNLLKEKVPLVFDNKKDSGVAGDNNIQHITLDQANQFNIKPVSTPDAFTFLFPFSPPQGKAIRYSRSLSEILPGGIDKSTAASKGIKDNYQFSIPKNSIMLSSMNAHISISQALNSDDPHLAQEMRIIYYDPDADMTYVMWYVFNKPVKTSLAGAKDFVTFSEQEWKKLPKINPGDQIIDVPEDTTGELRLMPFKGENLAGASYVKNFVLKIPYFSTTSDSKLLVLQK